MKISACLVVRNEEKLLPRCLASIRAIVDEIIVVHDGPCEDESLEISKKYNARIFSRPLIGEAEYHRPFSYSKATGEWILQIDADEFLSEKAQKEIPRLVTAEKIDAYSFRWPYYSNGQYIPSGPFARTLKPCLFRKEKMFMIGISHEYLRTYGTLQKRIDILLEHKPQYNNFTKETFQKKWSKWARLQAMQILSIEKAPVFNIAQHIANKGFSYYIFMRQHPIFSGMQETMKFILIYISRGILWSGRQSIKIAFFDLSYIWLVRKYLIVLSRGR